MTDQKTIDSLLQDLENAFICWAHAAPGDKARDVWTTRISPAQTKIRKFMQDQLAPYSPNDASNVIAQVHAMEVARQIARHDQLELRHRRQTDLVKRLEKLLEGKKRYIKKILASKDEAVKALTEGAVATETILRAQIESLGAELMNKTSEPWVAEAKEIRGPDAGQVQKLIEDLKTDSDEFEKAPFGSEQEMSFGQNLHSGVRELWALLTASGKFQFPVKLVRDPFTGPIIPQAQILSEARELGRLVDKFEHAPDDSQEERELGCDLSAQANILCKLVTSGHKDGAAIAETDDKLRSRIYQLEYSLRETVNAKEQLAGHVKELTDLVNDQRFLVDSANSKLKWARDATEKFGIPGETMSATIVRLGEQLAATTKMMKIMERDLRDKLALALNKKAESDVAEQSLANLVKRLNDLNGGTDYSTYNWGFLLNDLCKKIPALTSEEVETWIRQAKFRPTRGFSGAGIDYVITSECLDVGIGLLRKVR